jgi:hypothetical protein
MLLLIAGAFFVSCAAAEEVDEDPVFFVVGDGAIYSGGEGWYAGYVIIDQSGTYTLRISANGPQGRFPVVNTKVIVCISNEAVNTATVTIGSDTATPLTVTSYIPTIPSYYGANGGVFAEDDYYGYNDQYVIASLTYSQIHHPDYYYPLQVTVNFSPEATTDSKVMFFCYGVDSKGDPAKTPFSGGTLIVATPEYSYAAIPLIVCLAAYGIYMKKKPN